MVKIIPKLLRIIFKTLNNLEVKGAEKIPRNGRLIIASNHASMADPPCMVSEILKVRHVHVLAKKELFSPAPLAWFFRKFSAIPVDRHKEGGDLSTMRESIKVLNNSGCLVVFPEGTRPRGREIAPKPGIGYLAHKTNSPVLPVRIFGSENFLKLGKITIKFGDIRFFKPSANEDLKESYLEFSRAVMSDIFSITLEG